MKQKRVLLLAGGGTLGGYTAEALVEQGCHVDVIAKQQVENELPGITRIRANIDDVFLTSWLAENRYDVIIDFLHYPDPSGYPQRGEFLLDNTDQLIFLSSYRVYANEEHPIRESSPQLLDAYADDRYLLENDCYGISKCREERVLRASGRFNWTIVRPLISFSYIRFDLITQGAWSLLPRSAAHKPILLPEAAREKVAGLGWAGNIGHMIALLAGNEKALGEAFTLGSGEKNTWGQIATYYEDLLGAKFEWIETESYLENATMGAPSDRINLYYDRLFHRSVDNEKVLQATGIRRGDLLHVQPALELELEKVKNAPDPRLQALLCSNTTRILNKKMDEYIRKRHKVEFPQTE